jgi:hypothetical protein
MGTVIATNGGSVLAGYIPVEGGTPIANMVNDGTITASGGQGLGGGYYQTSSITMNPTVLTNSGTIDAVNGGTIAIQPASPFTNTGVITVDSTSSIVVNTGYSQTSGLTNIDGTLTVSDGSAITISGGKLSGAGTLSGALVNQGTVAPGSAASPGALTVSGNHRQGSTASPGTLTVTGNYTQGSTGVLDIGLGGAATGEYDALSVGGSATLAGAIDVQLVDGFVPAVNETFDILSCGGTLTGELDVVSLDPGYLYQVSYLDAGQLVQLTYTGIAPVPGPNSLAVLSFGLGGISFVIRRRARRIH